MRTFAPGDFVEYIGSSCSFTGRQFKVVGLELSSGMVRVRDFKYNEYWIPKTELIHINSFQSVQAQAPQQPPAMNEGADLLGYLNDALRYVQNINAIPLVDEQFTREWTGKWDMDKSKCDCGGFKTYNSMSPEMHSNWCSSRKNS